MGPIDEQTERLIVRKLDGELSADQEHELNKLLIRWPEARQLLDDYLEQDRLSAEVLAEEVGIGGAPDLEVITAGWTRGERARRNRPWAASSMGGLLVACLALFAVLWRPAAPLGQRAGGVGDNGMDTARSSAMGMPVSVGEQFQRLPEYLELPQTQEQELARQFIGVYDEQTGRYYVLEVRRVCTNTRLVSGGT